MTQKEEKAEDTWSSKATVSESSEDINMVITEEVDNTNNVKKHTFGKYELYELRNILTPEECDTLIELAKAKGMEDSSVLAYGKEKDTETDTDYRKSKQTWFEDNASPVIQKIADYCEQITGLPKANQEMIQVAHYETGGKFNAHYDACVYEDKTYCDKINRNAGQRKTTLLIYLNDDYTGGETEFTNLNLKIKPEKGKGILFYDTDENQTIYEESKHMGNAVISGEKWICTKWVHFGEFK